MTQTAATTGACPCPVGIRARTAQTVPRQHPLATTWIRTGRPWGLRGAAGLRPFTCSATTWRR
eukprot:8569169-Alexandrium_andersonii.AAC.1